MFNLLRFSLNKNEFLQLDACKNNEIVEKEKYIELKNITKRYKDITAVDDLSMTVYEGDIFGFLGPNGAGKSTSIRMMLSLVNPTSGYINMFGYDIRTQRHEVLRNIGALIERPDFYDYLPARKNLQILGKLSDIKNLDDRIEEVLDLTGLSDRAESKVKTYSQGMKQRLGIAQSLLHNPKMIILDEPANGLDPQGQKEMRELIRTINRDKGITILLSSHILSEIEEVANRMVIINNGKSVVEGDVAQLLNESELRVTMEVNNPQSAYDLLENSLWKDKLHQMNESSITLELEKAEIPAVNRLLSESGIEVFAIKPIRSLENYFLKITQNG